MKIIVDRVETMTYKGEAMPEEIVLPTLNCGICGHTWVRRKTTRPVKCPECNSPNWDRTDFQRVSKKRASVRPESAKETLAVSM